MVKTFSALTLSQTQLGGTLIPCHPANTEPNLECVRLHIRTLVQGLMYMLDVISYSGKWQAKLSSQAEHQRQVW